MCSVRGEIGQEATVQLEGILLSRDEEKMERESALYIGGMPRGRGRWGGELDGDITVQSE